ncbi:MAG: prenyltransferase, partial [Planctomycetia bacterium]|nr:prenyltransferase [Planctomycetia bacterium]
MRPPSRRSAAFALRLLLAAGVLATHAPRSFAQGAGAGKGEGGFGDARAGDVPEGAAELITPQTDRAIRDGLAWLSKQQNADGSFGSGTYRGNIAVTSLAGLAFMAAGSSPGRGPYGSQIDRAL